VHVHSARAFVKFPDESSWRTVKHGGSRSAAGIWSFDATSRTDSLCGYGSCAGEKLVFDAIAERIDEVALGQHTLTSVPILR
jgi:hypothetical protein